MSLLAGQKDSRNTRPDDTILDGHHRIKILQSRGVNGDALPRENQELELGAQSNLTQARGLLFISLPTEDRGVPPSGDDASFSVAKIEEMLRQGKNVALHCRPGIGRLGMIAAAGLVQDGSVPDDSMKPISDARGLPVPETPEPRDRVRKFSPREAPSPPRATRISGK